MREKLVTKKSILTLLLMFALFISFSLISLFSVKADGVYIVALDTPFSSATSAQNPSTRSKVTKNDDGTFNVKQQNLPGDGSMNRLYYGYGTEPYKVDLTDFKIEMSIESIATANRFTIAFMSDRDDYPMDVYGKGIALFLDDDSAGNTGFITRARKFPGNVSFEGAEDWYLIYNNVSPRTSYLGKKFFIQTQKSGDNISITYNYYEDDSGNSVIGGGYNIPISALPAGFDYSEATVLFTCDGGTEISSTIYSISDVNTANYENQIGGKTNNTLNYIAEYLNEHKSFNTETATIDNVLSFYSAYNKLSNLNNLRGNDNYEKTSAIGLDKSLIDAKAVSLADDIFAIYTASYEVTAENAETVEKVINYYKYNQSNLSAYSENATYLEGQLVNLNNKQQPVIDAIDELLDNANFSTINRLNYKQAQQAYDVVIVKYNSLNDAEKAKVTNYSLLQEFYTKLSNAKNDFYSTSGTYFTNAFDFSSSKVSAIKNNDASTTLTIPEVVGNAAESRVAYGADTKDYKIDLTNFSISYILNEVEKNARFSFNFANARGVYPWGGEEVPGINIILRMNGSNAFDIALGKVAGGTYLNTAGIGDNGVIGSLNSTTGIVGKKITYSFTESGDNIVVTVSLEGSGNISHNIPKAKFNELNVNYTQSIMSITMGEGLNPFNNNKDLVLTVTEINDDYYRSVAQLSSKFEEFNLKIDTLSVKDSLTIAEVDSFNKLHALFLNLYLRTYEKQDFEAKLETLDTIKFDKINQMASAIIDAQIALIPQNITTINYTETQTLINSIKSNYEKLSNAQQLSIINYSVVSDTESIINTLIEDITSANVVIEKINSIPSYSEIISSNYDDALSYLNNATNSYSALSANAKELVTNYSVLTSLKSKIDAYDLALANSVDVLFTGINGNTTITLENAAKIFVAVTSYDNLNETQKALTNIKSDIVTIKSELEAFMVENEGLDGIAAAIVDQFINDIGKVEYLAASKKKIDKAREEYNKLTAEQKALVANLQILTTAETTYAALKIEAEDLAAANNVIDGINQANTTFATISGSNKASAITKVSELKQAYNNLTSSQKLLVTNYDKVGEIEARIAAYDQYVNDFGVATMFDDEVISAKNTYETITSENLEAAKTEILKLNNRYNELTESQKELVEKFEEISAISDKVSAYETNEQNKSAANSVINLINAIGEVGFNDSIKAKIESARNGYNALTAEQKALVSNYTTLQDAEHKYEELKNESQVKKGGCKSSLGEISLVFVLIVALYVFITLKKKSKV